MKPTDHEKALEEWAKHNPFERASKDLIRRVQQAMRYKQQQSQEPALI